MTTTLNGEMLFKNLRELRSTDSGTITTVENFKVITTEDDFDLIDEKAPDEIKHEREEARKSESIYLQKYASFENLAQELAYDKSLRSKKEGDSITITETDGRQVSYYVRHLQTENAGLVAHVLTPVNPTDSFDVKVLFQGTDPWSLSSVWRNREKNGAGAESFALHKLSLLKQVNEIMMEKNPSRLPTTMTVAGHSLGGADTQNFATAVMDTVVNKGLLYPELAKIQKLTIFTANSAGVPQATADHAAKLAADIAQLRKNGKTNLTIESYNKRVGRDGVQKTGEAHILSNVPPEHAKVDVLKAHIDCKKSNLFSWSSVLPIAAGAVVAGPVGALAGAALSWGLHAYRGIAGTGTAHSTNLLKEGAPQVDYERLSNATPNGQREVEEQYDKCTPLNKVHSVVYENPYLAPALAVAAAATVPLLAAGAILDTGMDGIAYAWKQATNALTQPNVGDAPTASPFLIPKVQPPVEEPKSTPPAPKKGWFPRFGF